MQSDNEKKPLKTESAPGQVILMPDEARDMRDMLIEIRSDVKQLISTKADHESRLREHETSITTMKATSEESQKSTKRLLAWGMALAALAGGLGDILKHAINGQ